VIRCGTKASAAGERAPARKATRATALIDDLGMIFLSLGLKLKECSYWLDLRI